MTDINKQIEEAKELLECIIQNPNSTIGSKEFDLIETSARLLTLNLHSSRWRKVSEELPPMETFVLIVNSDGGMRILSFNSTDIEEKLEFYCVEYWMPIPDRPLCNDQL